MIEPELFGPALIADVMAPLPRDRAKLWPMGQSGLVVRFSKAVALFDLYLSHHCEAVLPRPFDHRRLARAPMDPAEIDFADVILCSHGHLDHFDVPTLRTLVDSSPQATLITPRSVVPAALDLGWSPSRVRGTRDGDVVQAGGLEITAFAVPHEEYDLDEADGHPYQGYLVSDGTVSVAHTGDALADARLASVLRKLEPDLLCVPINGRDSQRAEMGFAGNMTAEEAVELAVEAGVAAVLPMHDDMFAQNIDVGARERFEAAAALRGIRVVRPPLAGGAHIASKREMGVGIA